MVSRNGTALRTKEMGGHDFVHFDNNARKTIFSTAMSGLTAATGCFTLGRAEAYMHAAVRRCRIQGGFLSYIAVIHPIIRRHNTVRWASLILETMQG